MDTFSMAFGHTDSTSMYKNVMKNKNKNSLQLIRYGYGLQHPYTKLGTFIWQNKITWIQMLPMTLKF